MFPYLGLWPPQTNCRPPLPPLAPEGDSHRRRAARESQPQPGTAPVCAHGARWDAHPHRNRKPPPRARQAEPPRLLGQVDGCARHTSRGARVAPACLNGANPHTLQGAKRSLDGALHPLEPPLGHRSVTFSITWHCPVKVLERRACSEGVVVCVCDNRGQQPEWAGDTRAVAGAPCSRSPEAILRALRCPSLTVRSRGANVLTWAPMSCRPISENLPGQPSVT